MHEQADREQNPNPNQKPVELSDTFQPVGFNPMVKEWLDRFSREHNFYDESASAELRIALMEYVYDMHV